MAPSVAVLGHRNTCCFVSHCGANSAHEGLAQGKPIVPLPFFDDQYYIASVIEKLMGYNRQNDYTPLRKAALRNAAGAGVPVVEAAVRLGLAVSQQTLYKLKKSVWEEDGACTATEMVRARIKAAPKLRKPKFGKVARVKPESKGLNLMLKVVRSEEDTTSTAVKTWEVIAGDASGVVTLRLTNDEHAKACQPEASIRVQNARTSMTNGCIRVVIDKWGVLKAADTAFDFDVSTANDISSVEYELR